MPIGHCRQQLLRRAVRKGGWTKAKRARFLDVLAATCNITRSAEAVGLSTNSARALKRRDPEFALLWAAALREGTERLRTEIIAYSLGQLGTGENPGGDREEPETTGPFDVREARHTLETLAKLEGRGPGRGDRPDYASDEQVTLLLTERLEALAERQGRA